LIIFEPILAIKTNTSMNQHLKS